MKADKTTQRAGILAIFITFMIAGFLPDILESLSRSSGTHHRITDRYIMMGEYRTITICLDDSLVYRGGREREPRPRFKPLVDGIISNYWEKLAHKPIDEERIWKYRR